jgi:hypothetical protein
MIKPLVDKGKSLEKPGHPLGNNCDGFIVLKSILQGFDV